VVSRAETEMRFIGQPGMRNEPPEVRGRVRLESLKHLSWPSLQSLSAGSRRRRSRRPTGPQDFVEQRFDTVRKRLDLVTCFRASRSNWR
jgi:hypothetical protein